MNRWLFDLDAFGVIVPIVSPYAVMLLVVMGVGAGWGCPISVSVTRMGVACMHP